jgi:hypothetical protein
LEDLPRGILEVAHLRERLSGVLLDHIKSELPTLIREIQHNLNESIEESEPEAEAPELMRLRIISVAAKNCGTYLGGESDTGASPMPLAAGGLKGPPESIATLLT